MSSAEWDLCHWVSSMTYSRHSCNSQKQVWFLPSLFHPVHQELRFLQVLWSSLYSFLYISMLWLVPGSPLCSNRHSQSQVHRRALLPPCSYTPVQVHHLHHPELLLRPDILLYGQLSRLVALFETTSDQWGILCHLGSSMTYSCHSYDSQNQVWFLFSLFHHVHQGHRLLQVLWSPLYSPLYISMLWLRLYSFFWISYYPLLVRVGK